MAKQELITKDEPQKLPEYKAAMKTIKKSVTQIEKSIKTIISHRVRIGEQLVILKEDVKHGAFQAAVEELGMSKQQVSEYVNTYKLLNELSPELQNMLPTTGIRELVKKATPAKAVEAVVELLQNGEEVTTPLIKDIIAQHKVVTLSNSQAQALIDSGEEETEEASNVIEGQFTPVPDEEDAQPEPEVDPIEAAIALLTAHGYKVLQPKAVKK
ncbi:hypothetical protein [Vibrio harveyi]|uniref:hypothetical protein n=1 Tax=Vibrio harveyi TaxID=669 RepID=UPI0018F122A0|nr:hypothetical protein [Vibrio harveyi]